MKALRFSKTELLMVMTICMLLFLRSPALAVNGNNNGNHNGHSHDFIMEYDGPSTCVSCHREEISEMFGSVHYQWTGPTPNATNITGNAGKGVLGFNTYCGSIFSSRRIACWTCHVGYGGVPAHILTDQQLNNIDCLTCHQELYRRVAAPPFEQLTYTGYDGATRSWTLPVEDAEGNFQFMPNESAMTISILEAAQTVHLPTRTSCLSCHAYAAGSDCGKRGDLSSETAMAPMWAEIHMSPDGANLSCQACHEEEDHRILGRGLDIRPNDRPERLTCISVGCHSGTPHDSTRLNNHTARVACQTCHIPLFAKLRSTEIDRDWNNPFWFPGMFNGQGGFKPEEIRQSMVIPSYQWYNGTSRVYVLGQQPILGPTGLYELGLPNGWVNTNGALIYPMKEHFSNSAMHDATGQMIPFATFIYFVTGDFARAVTAGQEYAGLTGPWTEVNVHTYQTINHGVEPADQALSCGACHGDLSDTGVVRMDLQGQLGYELKNDPAVVCTQCHELEESEGFVALHEEHVSDEGFDCSYCHNFSRSQTAVPENCFNGYDDDGDSFTDCADPDCEGLENGLCDTGLDGICAEGTLLCQDGISVCWQNQEAVTEICKDKLDNDCDGLVDNADPDCMGENAPPDCAKAYASTDCLWPPNHKMIPVSILGVTDPDGDTVTITINSITSDESTATIFGAGGKKFAPDASGVDTTSAMIRAERSGRKDGRVYVINFMADDGKGGMCSGSVMVNTPHNKSKSCEAVDSGQKYDATEIN